jgi:hypothetical protein
MRHQSQWGVRSFHAPYMPWESTRMSRHRKKQTLDRGSFDVYRLLVMLRRLGYEGPIGLQCYGVKGDRHENLQRTIEAWRGFVERMGKEAN